MPIAAYDLTPVILQYLDYQLANELLHALMNNEFQRLYDQKCLAKLKYSLVQKTQLYGDAQDLIQSLYEGKELDDLTVELEKKEEELIQSHNSIIAGDTGVGIYTRTVATDAGQEKMKQMIRDHTMALEGMEAFGMTAKHLKEIMAFARRVYEYGQHAQCGKILRFLRLVDPTTYKENGPRLWGQLASGILCCLMEEEGASWKETNEDLVALNEFIDTTTCELNVVLYFLHWSLFVYLQSRIPTGREQLLEVFLSEKYATLIRSSAPHLVRYICVALLTTRNSGQRRGARSSPALKSLREFLEQEPFNYRDPIVEVVMLLFIQGNANAALERLGECEEVLGRDYFLRSLRHEFIECMRRYCFEDVCRLHQTVDLHHVAKMLNCDLAEAERWIVNVIRPARINARVDSAKGILSVQAERTTPSASHLIMDKTQLLSFRVQSLHKTCMDARAPSTTTQAQHPHGHHHNGHYREHHHYRRDHTNSGNNNTNNGNNNNANSTGGRAMAFHAAFESNRGATNTATVTA